MQSAVPLGEGGMLAVLGAEIEQVKKSYSIFIFPVSWLEKGSHL